MKMVWIMILECYAYYAYYACIVLIMLYAHAHDDGATLWHHQVNTIKGGFSFLFTIGNADFELTTSVLFCLPQVNKCSVIYLII